ncbi:hypothetical protein EQ832_25185 [Pseudomonas sp. ALS1131]|nr:hypothetical protein EQ832_25185 [Pseudomonas sp. ALS1131]
MYVQREVKKEAIRQNADVVSFPHNHLSGNPQPRQTDKLITLPWERPCCASISIHWITSS